MIVAVIAENIVMGNAVEHFTEDLRLIIDRTRLEYKMSYAELIGVLEVLEVLEIVKNEMIEEAFED